MLPSGGNIVIKSIGVSTSAVCASMPKGRGNDKVWKYNAEQVNQTPLHQSFPWITVHDVPLFGFDVKVQILRSGRRRF